MKPMKARRFRARSEYLAASDLYQQEYVSYLRTVEDLKQAGKPYFSGYCAVCDRESEFELPAMAADADIHETDAKLREGLRCLGCGLAARKRAAFHAFLQFCEPNPRDRIYICEQISPLFKCLSSEFERVTGSEFLGEEHVSGRSYRIDGVQFRHEDLTRLSFASGSLEHILAFDVLEHVPNYRKALGECGRCLAPGGRLLLSVPFWLSRDQTHTRASVLASGEIVHHENPQYHGDPLNEKGLLCYYDYGWDILPAVAESGISDASLLIYWDPDFGYLSWAETFVLARKEKR